MRNQRRPIGLFFHELLDLVHALRKNDLLKAEHHALEDEEQYIGKLVRRGDDGIWFVDYVRAVETELDDIDM